MSRITLTSPRVRVLFVLSVCALFCGCVVPARTAMKARNARGEGLRKGDALAEKVDLSFIQVGRTTRTRVEEKLGCIAEQAPNGHLVVPGPG